MLLYIHGFNSSPLSHKAQVLKQWLAEQGCEQRWACPDLPHRPSEAIALLQQIIAQSSTPVKLIGSSLGGFYATYLARQYDLKAVLINPAVHPSVLLRPALGTIQTGWHDSTHYTFTQAHLDDLQALDYPAPANPEKLLVMLETGDETLDWQDAASYYRDAHQLIFQGGDHGFSRFADVLELIERF